MSLSSRIDQIMERIESASEDSKLAVFRSEGVRDGKNKKRWEIEPALDVLFESTVMTRKRIKDDNKRYIGSFHRGMDMLEVQNALRDEIHALFTA